MIALIGEIMVDCFPDGSERLGGCALNVAWHLKGLGLDPLLVSRVGNDPRGMRVLSAMKGWGLRTEAVGVDDEHATGAVHITFDAEGRAVYWTPPVSAIDFISAHDARTAASQADFLYHGSFIHRAPVSKAAVEAAREERARRFVDVNLREPYWSAESVEWAVRGAHVLKATDEELGSLMGTTVLRSSETGRLACQKFGVQTVLVTMAERGALSVEIRGGTLSQEGFPVPEFRNAVGAGDGFSAAYLFALTKGAAPARCLEFACAFGAAICGLEGAIPAVPTFYSSWPSKCELFPR